MPLTKREAAVITAYTGKVLGNFSDAHEYMEEILGRPVFTHELAIPFVCDEIQEKSRADFLKIHAEIVP